ncbi:MAG: ANTAR domain-containing response regulator [Sphaerochaeta sp.]
MEKILIAATPEKAVKNIEALVREAGYYNISEASSGAQARRLIAAEDWDIVIIDHPLSDDDSSSLIRMLVEHSDASPVLLVKPELIHEIEAELSGTATVFAEKPLSKKGLFQALDLAASIKGKIEKLKAQNATLEARLEDMKYINRAKIALIINKGMSENQAHRFIEKMAMDKRSPKREIAKAIIRLFSN